MKNKKPEGKKTRTLPKLLLTEKEFEIMEEARSLINDNSLLEISQPKFRQMAIKHFSEDVINKGLVISIKPKE